MFPLKTERSSSGLIEFSSIAQAVMAIMKCNHTAIDAKGTKLNSQNPQWNSQPEISLLGTKFPFIMKLCFSSSKNLNSTFNNEIDKSNGVRQEMI